MAPPYSKAFFPAEGASSSSFDQDFHDQTEHESESEGNESAGSEQSGSSNQDGSSSQDGSDSAASSSDEERSDSEFLDEMIAAFEFNALAFSAFELYCEQFENTTLSLILPSEQARCASLLTDLIDAMYDELEGKGERDSVSQALRAFRDYELSMVRRARFANPVRVGQAVFGDDGGDVAAAGTSRRSRRVAGQNPLVHMDGVVRSRPDEFIINSVVVAWDALSRRQQVSRRDSSALTSRESSPS